MSKIKPFHEEIFVNYSIAEAKEAVLSNLLQLNGKVVKNDKNLIECHFGSTLKSKLIGELWVKKETLPKKAIINFEDAGNQKSRITLDITDSHKFGFKTGFVKKYEESLEELAEMIKNIFI